VIRKCKVLSSLLIFDCWEISSGNLTISIQCVVFLSFYLYKWFWFGFLTMVKFTRLVIKYPSLLIKHFVDLSIVF
ncbi:hypothetical protein KSS87_009997, partial [Heliosperma pusillum]